MNIDFRNELFMASRDRLKQGDESSTLRRILGDNLRTGQLKDVYKERKANISIESAEDENVLLSLADELPISREIRGLLSQTFKLEPKDKSPKRKPQQSSEQKQQIEFNPKRYPSFFRLEGKQNNGTPVMRIPLGSSRTIKFDSDVENGYFDRVDDPGELYIAIMTHKPNDETGGNRKGSVNEISEIFSVNKRSPNNGTIKVILNPTEELELGDEVEIKVDLTSPSGPLSERFWVKITNPLPPKSRKFQSRMMTGLAFLITN